MRQQEKAREHRQGEGLGEILRRCECLWLEIPSRGKETARGSLQQFRSNSKGMY